MIDSSEIQVLARRDGLRKWVIASTLDISRVTAKRALLSAQSAECERAVGLKGFDPFKARMVAL